MKKAIPAVLLVALAACSSGGSTPPLVPATINIAAGNRQAAAAGTPVAIDPAVRVQDADGKVVAGVPVTFTVEAGGGSVSAAAVTTGPDGIATARWTLGTAAGVGNNVLKVAAAVGEVWFSASADAGAPARVTKIAGDGQVAWVGLEVPVPPAVLVADGLGNGVPGAAIACEVTAGGGHVERPTTTTDAAGQASCGAWTLGPAKGPNALTVTVAGVAPAVFSASATLPPATLNIAAGNNQTAEVGTPVAVNPAVRVQDSEGAPVAGVPVTFAVSAGGGAVSVAEVATGPDGIASTSWTLGLTPGDGNNVLAASSIAGPTVWFSASAAAGPAALITKVAGDGQVAVPGQAVETSPAVKVTDARGNAVAGAAVTCAVTAGGGRTFLPATVTDAAGKASCGAWTLGDARGANALSFSVGALPPAVFSASSDVEVLLDLGHTSAVPSLFFSGSRVLSQDQAGRWNLWSYDSCAIVASGRAVSSALAGSTFVVQTSDGLEIRETAQGAVLGRVPGAIAAPAWWKLASDGSYLSIGTGAGLSILSTAGALLASRAGDYSRARVFAAPGAVRVAGGPAGANVIETIDATTGAASVSAPFTGQFHSWFLGGERFLSTLSTTAWVYSSAGTQEAVLLLPTVTSLTGQGSWIWIYDGGVKVYAVSGGGTPAATFAVNSPIGSGDAVLVSGPGLIDLSGATPVLTTYPAALQSPTSFAATGSSRWVAANARYQIVDGASLATTPRACNRGGTVASLAGGAQRGVLATDGGEILQFDAVTGVFGTPLAFASSKLGISSDGTTLAALGSAPGDRTLDVWSLPSWAPLRSWASTDAYPYNADFSLSGSGLVVARAVKSSSGQCDREVAPVAGGAPTWSDTISGDCTAAPVSPDGRLVATQSFSWAGCQYVTNVFKDGAFSTAVPGRVVGWIDDTRLLVNDFIQVGRLPTCMFNGVSVYSVAGAKLLTFSPASHYELWSFQPVSADEIYVPRENLTYSLTTGAVVWSTSIPSTMGAVAGSRVVFVSGSRLLSQLH